MLPHHKLAVVTAVVGAAVPLAAYSIVRVFTSKNKKDPTPYTFSQVSPYAWTTAQVCEWLGSKGVSKGTVTNFLRADISGRELASLTQRHVMQLCASSDDIRIVLSAHSDLFGVRDLEPKPSGANPRRERDNSVHTFLDDATCMFDVIVEPLDNRAVDDASGAPNGVPDVRPARSLPPPVVRRPAGGDAAAGAPAEHRRVAHRRFVAQAVGAAGCAAQPAAHARRGGPGRGEQDAATTCDAGRLSDPLAVPGNTLHFPGGAEQPVGARGLPDRKGGHHCAAPPSPLRRCPARQVRAGVSATARPAQRPGERAHPGGTRRAAEGGVQRGTRPGHQQATGAGAPQLRRQHDP
ncbi:hypothetical protein STCU_11781 [Strigomonas culicis]|uniref:SAM domain-containing protein n=1 Tax=Strigomonas culicis TaxID=28005 RepID=S9UZ00_9TRYP|nr:hypothetical protein STCU_11781 [Strigomonas culicis]|eukprot:EPY15765.1 hypothetical protein STCU_11781 [Strigomonas culicis]